MQISFTRPLEKRQGQALFFRSPEAIGKNSRFEIGGNTDNLRVWDISQAEHVANQTIKAENGLAAFAIPASDSLRQFVAFTPEDVQRPLFSGLQKPQDLASVKDAEYLIVTHPLFKAQAEALAALANGAFYIGYMGHGDPDARGNDRLLKVENIQNWEESYAYPILFSFACSFATMDNPFQLSGTEAAVLHPDGGCIAAAGATGEFHIGSGVEEMHRRFLQHLLQTEDGNPVTLGDAWIKAKSVIRLWVDCPLMSCSMLLA